MGRRDGIWGSASAGMIAALLLLLLLNCVSAHAQTATLYGPVNDASAAQVVAQIQASNAKDPGDKPIILFIDSGGGSLSAGLKIIDAMMISRRPVWTVDVSMAASMGAIVFSYGKKRAMLPSAMLMLHNEKGATSGSAEQILAEVGAFNRLIEPIRKHLAAQAGISVETLKERLADGWWMLADEAVKAHMATEIINLEQYPIPTPQMGARE